MSGPGRHAADDEPARRVRALLEDVGRAVRPLGVDEWVRVGRLLDAQPGWDPSVLRASLASLLARDEDEWHQIADLFDRIVLEGTEPIGPVDHGAPASSPKPMELPTSESPAPGLWARHARWIVSAALVVAIGSVVGLLISSRPPPPPVEKTPTGEPPPPRDVMADTYLERLVVPGADEARLVPARRAFDPLRDTLGLLAGALFLALGVRFLLLPGASRAGRRSRARSDFEERNARFQAAEKERLVRRDADARASTGPLRVPYRVPPHLAVSGGVADRAAGLLRRVRDDLATYDLDVRATISATIAAGGRATPRFEAASAAVDPVVLFDVEEESDYPWRRGFERVLDRWARQGVRFERYNFRFDPDAGVAPHRSTELVSMSWLARRHAGHPLLLFSRAPLVERYGGAACEWLLHLEAFSATAWLDPDPRPPGGQGRRKHDIVAERLRRRRMERFLLDERGLIAAVMHLGSGGVATRPPRSTPLLPLSALPEPGRGRVDIALRLWATACAMVPDAGWDQAEALRAALPEVNEVITDARDVARLLDWIDAQPEQEHSKAEEHDHIAFQRSLTLRLRRSQLAADRALVEGGLDRHKTFTFRVHALLRAQLEGTRPADQYLQAQWELRRIEHDLYLRPDQVEDHLDALGGLVLREEAREMLELVRDEGLAEVPGCEAVVRQAEQFLERTAAPTLGPSADVPGVEVREVLGGLPRVWGLAAGAAVLFLVGAVFGVRAAPRWGASQAWRESLLTVGFRDEPRRDTRDLYVLRKADKSNLRPIMLTIPAGEFLMGSPKDEKDRFDDEVQHRVKITRPFLLAQTEILQRQYSAVVGDNPSQYKDCGDDCPVESLSWLDAVKYCNALSAKESRPPCYRIEGDKVAWEDPRCTGYRLPTEAEWEYAARGGVAGQRFAGAQSDEEACTVGNVSDEDGELPFRFSCHDGFKTTSPAKKFRANGFGLYDMTGNVYEWTWDWYKGYDMNVVDDPRGPEATGESRVFRGGSWSSVPRLTRVAYRIPDGPSLRFGLVGFRVARSL